MSGIGTATGTFTAADIRKVVDNFAADFSMMAQSTGLHTRDYVEKIVSDLKVFSEARILTSVTLILRNSAGEKIRGAVYTVSNAAAGWQTERPGGSLWPRTLGGSLKVTASLDGWSAKSAEAKSSFIAQKGLNWPWDPSKDNNSLSSLTTTSGQKYESNGYGWQRTNYSS